MTDRVVTFEDWQIEASRCFAPGRRPYGYGLLATFAGPLVPYLDGPVCLMIICGRHFKFVNTIVQSVWKEIPRIEISHEFSPADPPLTQIVHLEERDPNRVRQFLRDYEKSNARTLVIIPTPRKFGSMFEKHRYKRMMFYLVPTGIPRGFPEMSRVRGVPGSMYREYIEQPAIKDWLAEAVPSLARQLFVELGEENERLWLRCNTFAVFLTAAKILEDTKLVTLSASRIRSELMHRIAASTKMGKWAAAQEQDDGQDSTEGQGRESDARVQVGDFAQWIEEGTTRHKP